MSDVDPYSETPDKEAAEEYEKPDYWRKWIKAAKKAAEGHWQDSKAAYAEFDNKPVSGDKEARKDRPYPIYKSSCITIKPAFYSRTPKILSEREFGAKDPVALTGSLIVEELGKYFTRRTRFDDVMRAAVSDVLHADKATTQVIYEAETEEQRIALSLSSDGTQFLGPTGQPFEGQAFEENGAYFGVEQVAIPETQKIYAAPICYDEILHTPDAKTEAEIQDKAYFFCMDEVQAKSRFAEKAEAIRWKTGKKYGDDKKDDAAECPGKYVEGWEIWCKRSKKVYWLSEQYQEGFLDVKDDPYKLEGFFPSPAFVINNKPAKSLYPTPLYVDLKPLLEDLHDLGAQLPELAKAARPRAVVDGSNPDVLQALTDLESGEFAAVRNLQQIVEKGGLANLIHYLPVADLVAAIGRVIELEQRAKNLFYEWFGVPDVMRGASDPIETAAAQEVKQQSAHDRFKDQKKQVASLASETIQMMVDLALGVFGDEKIARITGYQYMSPENQQRFPEALAFLRNDDERIIRVSVDSDSLSFLDEQLKSQQTQAAAGVVNQGLQMIAQMSAGDPTFIPAGLEVLLASLEAMPLGKQFSDRVQQTIQQLIEAKKQPPQAPPPPPDYEGQKLQLQAQKQQIEAANTQRELDQKEYKLQLEAQKQVSDAQIDQFRAQLENTIAQFQMQIENQRVQIEQFQAQMQARESEMEEIRLARETDAKAYQEAVKTAQEAAPKEVQPPQIINVSAPAMPPITVNVEAAKPGNKRIDAIRDEMGNTLGYQVAEEPQIIPAPMMPMP